MIKPSVTFEYGTLEYMGFTNAEHAELIYGTHIKRCGMFFDLSQFKSNVYYVNFVIKNTGIYRLEDFLLEELSTPTDYINSYFRKKNGLNISYENDKIIIPILITQSELKKCRNSNRYYYIKLYFQTVALNHDRFNKSFCEENTYIEFPENQNIPFIADSLSSFTINKLNNKIECVMSLNYSFIHHEDKMADINKRISNIKAALHRYPKDFNIKFKRGEMSSLILLTNIPLDRKDILSYFIIVCSAWHDQDIILYHP